MLGRYWTGRAYSLPGDWSPETLAEKAKNRRAALLARARSAEQERRPRADGINRARPGVDDDQEQEPRARPAVRCAECGGTKEDHSDGYCRGKEGSASQENQSYLGPTFD